MCNIFYRKTKNRKRAPKPEVATAPIVVFKTFRVRDHKYVSFYKEKEWQQEGMVEESHLRLTPEYEINRRTRKYRLIGWVSEQGFYSYEAPKSAFDIILCDAHDDEDTEYIVCMCVIPKGARYYKQDGKYLSNKLVITLELGPVVTLAEIEDKKHILQRHGVVSYE